MTVTAGLVLAMPVLLVGSAVACHEEPLAPGSPDSVPTPAIVRFEPGFENGGRCPPGRGPGLPPNSGCVTRVDADLDGDGRRDAFIVYARTSESGKPRSWRAVAALAGGEEFALQLKPPDHSYPMALGAEDIDADGGSEVFVKVLDFLFHSAASTKVGLFHITDAGLGRVRTNEGHLFEIMVGGITQLGEGADCVDVDGDGRLEIRLLRIKTRDHTFERWNATERTYEWRGDVLERTRRRSRWVHADSYIDPDVRRYYELSCGSFDPPPPY